MNGALSKEQRRNLQRAVGETAVQAIEACRSVAVAVDMQQRVLAKEHLSLHKQVVEGIERLDGRCNATSARCDKAQMAHDELTADMEKRFACFNGRVYDIEGRAVFVDRRLDALENAGLVARLRFLAFGTWPALPTDPRDDNDFFV